MVRFTLVAPRAVRKSALVFSHWLEEPALGYKVDLSVHWQEVKKETKFYHFTEKYLYCTLCRIEGKHTLLKSRERIHPQIKKNK